MIKKIKNWIFEWRKKRKFKKKIKKNLENETRSFTNDLFWW